MELSINELLIILAISLLPAILALQLGKELYK